MLLLVYKAETNWCLGFCFTLSESEVVFVFSTWWQYQSSEAAGGSSRAESSDGSERYSHISSLFYTWLSQVIHYYFAHTCLSADGTGWIFSLLAFKQNAVVTGFVPVFSDWSICQIGRLISPQGVIFSAKAVASTVAQQSSRRFHEDLAECGSLRLRGLATFGTQLSDNCHVPVQKQRTGFQPTPSCNPTGQLFLPWRQISAQLNSCVPAAPLAYGL